MALVSHPVKWIINSVWYIHTWMALFYRYFLYFEGHFLIPYCGIFKITLLYDSILALNFGEFNCLLILLLSNQGIILLILIPKDLWQTCHLLKDSAIKAKLMHITPEYIFLGALVVNSCYLWCLRFSKKKREGKKISCLHRGIKDAIRTFSHEVLSLKKDLDNLLKMGANYWTDMQQEREQLR